MSTRAGHHLLVDLYTTLTFSGVKLDTGSKKGCPAQGGDALHHSKLIMFSTSTLLLPGNSNGLL